MKIKILIIVLLLFFGVYGIIHVRSVNQGVIDDYNNYLKLARQYAEDDLPYVAKGYYLQAMAIDSNDSEVYKEYIYQLDKLSGTSKAAAWRGFIEKYPKEQEGYDKLGEIYYTSQDNTNLYNLILEANKKGMLTEKLYGYYDELYYKYVWRYNNLKSAGTYISNYAIIEDGSGYNYLFGTSLLLEDNLEYMGEYGVNGWIPAKKDGELVYIDMTGNIVARLKKPVTYLGTYTSTGALVGIDGKYGYMDADFNMPDRLEFEAATNITNGVGAVKKDGKWALINENKELISEYIYEDIKISENNICIQNGVVFAKRENKYVMLNALGNQIGKLEFEDACMFNGNEPAAVKINGKWGFVSADGIMSYEAQFQEAKSFGLGMAPVFDGLNWGYVAEREGKLEYVIKAEFDDCKAFTENGYAAVKQGDLWGYIQLFIYQ